MRCFPSINADSFVKPSHLESFFGLSIFKHCIVASMSCTLANSLHVLAINTKPNIDLSNRAILVCISVWFRDWYYKSSGPVNIEYHFFVQYKLFEHIISGWKNTWTISFYCHLLVCHKNCRKWLPIFKL